MKIKDDIKTKEFVKLNINTDPSELALKKNKYPDIDMDFVLRELSSRKKLSIKMPNWAENFELIMPGSTNIEQSSSFLTAKFKAEFFEYNNSLDLTAGFGIDSYYLASKSNNHICVEPSHDLVKILNHNFSTLGICNTAFISSSAESFLKRNTNQFDLIYIDPSRRDNNGSKKIRLQEYSPDVVELFKSLKEACNQLLIKISPMIDLTFIERIFPELSKIFVLSVNNECKEILLYFNFLSLHKNIHYHAVELGKHSFRHIFEKDEKLVIIEGFPDDYIYDVHPAITKSGFSDNYAMSFGLSKIGRNTNLYTSDTYIHNFSGKVYRLIDSVKPETKEIAKVLPDMSAIVIRKDFPLKVENIREKYKLKEGSKHVIFAVKLLDAKNRFLICERMLDS
ncbi:MAG: RsmD family RNA methyltransferase [Candidatus Kapaibacterium sp.]|jgi:hypothetical protein|nr:RsmD family RNA methyltransferase [Candidatus Kapabacteria bacterium]